MILQAACESPMIYFSVLVIISGVDNSLKRVICDKFIIFWLMVIALYQLAIKPMVELLMMKMKHRQMALMAVIAEGWLLIEMKFLKSLRFLKSSESVLVAYSNIFYRLVSLCLFSDFDLNKAEMFRLLEFLSEGAYFFGYKAMSLRVMP